MDTSRFSVDGVDNPDAEQGGPAPVTAAGQGGMTMVGECVSRPRGIFSPGCYIYILPVTRTDTSGRDAELFFQRNDHEVNISTALPP